MCKISDTEERQKADSALTLQSQAIHAMCRDASPGRGLLEGWAAWQQELTTAPARSERTSALCRLWQEIKQQQVKCEFSWLK